MDRPARFSPGLAPVKGPVPKIVAPVLAAHSAQFITATPRSGSSTDRMAAKGRVIRAAAAVPSRAGGSRKMPATTRTCSAHSSHGNLEAEAAALSARRPFQASTSVVSSNTPSASPLAQSAAAGRASVAGTIRAATNAHTPPAAATNGATVAPTPISDTTWRGRSRAGSKLSRRLSSKAPAAAATVTAAAMPSAAASGVERARSSANAPIATPGNIAGPRSSTAAKAIPAGSHTGHTPSSCSVTSRDSCASRK
jgi:hypothetical protein